MKSPRRPRALTVGEARLWREVAKLITPLKSRTEPSAGEPQPPAAQAGTPARPPAPAAAMPQSRPARTPSPADKPAPRAHPAKQHAAKSHAAKPPTAKPHSSKSDAAKPGQVKSHPGKFTPPAARPATAAPYQAPPQRPAPSAGLERQTRLALRRGRQSIEARIDLHGMVQSEAHAALTGFLLRCRAAGHGYVLVVTGKGGTAYADPFGERGVLRRSVPHWLRSPELRTIVIGFEEAAQHHGGGGALYVRLRRR